MITLNNKSLTLLRGVKIWDFHPVPTDKLNFFFHRLQISLAPGQAVLEKPTCLPAKSTESDKSGMGIPHPWFCLTFYTLLWISSIVALYAVENILEAAKNLEIL